MWHLYNTARTRVSGRYLLSPSPTSFFDFDTISLNTICQIFVWQRSYHMDWSLYSLRCDIRLCSPIYVLDDCNVRILRTKSTDQVVHFVQEGEFSNEMFIHPWLFAYSLPSLWVSLSVYPTTIRYGGRSAVLFAPHLQAEGKQPVFGPFTDESPSIDSRLKCFS